MPDTDLETRVRALEASNRRLIGAVLALAALLFLMFILTLAARAETGDCGNATAQVKPGTGECEQFATPCDVPRGWEQFSTLEDCQASTS